MSKIGKYILVIVPALYVLLGSYVHQVIGLYSLRSADPEYIYFSSGLCIACGKLHLGHIDNPGTPLQYLTALVMRAVYFFRSKELPFVDDVLAHSDMYLRVLNLVLTAVVAVFMYWAGKLAATISKNNWYGVALQTAPFFAAVIFGNIGRITPENLIPLPAMLLCLLLLKAVYADEYHENWRNALGYGLVSGFGLSIKLTYFPLWIIPLIVLARWKNRLVYSITAVLSFFVFAIPVLVRFNAFKGWVKGLFLHSGNYGKGEANIIDWSVVGPNFRQITAENHYFFLLILALAAVLIFSFFLKNDSREKLLQRIALGVIAAIAIQMAMVCKHFESRYFVPALMLAPMMLLLILELTRKWHVRWRTMNLATFAMLFFLSFYLWKQKPMVEALSANLDREELQKTAVLHYMKNLPPDAVKILVPGYYGAPVPDFALMTSYIWSLKQREFFKPAFARLYPNTYIYFFWDKTLNYWGAYPDFSRGDRPVYIYLEHFNHREALETDMKQYFPNAYQLEEVFANPATNEVVYQLTATNEGEIQSGE